MYTIITNNELIKTSYSHCIFVDGSFREVLIKCRDLIHKGYKLETSPLPASIRMLFSPVRTIILIDTVSNNESSTRFIEQAIQKYDITMGIREPDISNINDYMLLDLNLITNAIKEIPNFNIKGGKHEIRFKED